MDDCLTDEVLVSLLDGALLGEPLAQVHAHLAGCENCRTLVYHLVQTRSLRATSAPPSFDPANPPPQVGAFRIIKPLGQGAMGFVHLAHDTTLDRPVALKFIGVLAPGPVERQRFLREAQAIARLSHPHVVSIHAIDEIQGHPYLVAEFVQGTSLDKLSKPQPWQRVLRLALGLSAGLGAAHQSGVLHRDIKPANAIVDERDHVKLLDFGLAKLLELGGSARLPGGDPLMATESGVLIGTPRYLAPEAWDGSTNFTSRSDVYALGTVLYELCSGVPPHSGASLHALWLAATQSDVQPLRELAPAVMPAFAGIIDRCLLRDPNRRFKSGEELHQALLAVSDDLPRALSPSHRWSSLLPWAICGVVLSVGALSLWAPPRKHPHPPPAQRPPDRRPVPQAAPTGMVAIAGGSLQMGSTPAESKAAYEACLKEEQDPKKYCSRATFDRELPQHLVQVPPFWLAATEATIAEVASWLNQLPDLQIGPDRESGVPRHVQQGAREMVDLYPSLLPTFGLQHSGGRFVVLPGYEKHPMTHITWEGAQRFCAARGQRLPTEAEWEIAARGSDGRRYPWGYLAPRCDGVVFDRIKGGACAHLPWQTAEVGASLQDRTPEGVFDLGGNVMEWVLDRFDGPYQACAGACIDPPLQAARTPGDSTTQRVVRGGSELCTAVILRGVGRSRHRQGTPFTDVGFRCALSRPKTQ